MAQVNADFVLIDPLASASTAPLLTELLLRVSGSLQGLLPKFDCHTSKTIEPQFYTFFTFTPGKWASGSTHAHSDGRLKSAVEGECLARFSRNGACPNTGFSQASFLITQLIHCMRSDVFRLKRLQYFILCVCLIDVSLNTKSSKVC